MTTTSYSSATRASLPTRCEATIRALRPVPPGGTLYGSAPMSTRRLIIAALLCGLAILVAFAVQVSLID